MHNESLQSLEARSFWLSFRSDTMQRCDVSQLICWTRMRSN